MFGWIRDLYVRWKIKRMTMAQDELERALEREFGIPREHRVNR